MIKSINVGPYLNISNGSASSPYINNHNGQPMTGMVRHNNNRLEVYDGNIWQPFGEAYPTITLHEDAVKAIEWSLKAMKKEAELDKLIASNPAVKAAHENLLRSAEQLKTTILLSQDEKSTS